MGLAQRMKLGLRKMIPASTVNYKAPPEKLQSRLSDAQLRKLKSGVVKPGKYTFPKKPSNGIGVGH